MGTIPGGPSTDERLAFIRRHMDAGVTVAHPPSLGQVRAFVEKLTRLRGWIGEGDEIARDVLDYIDGRQTPSVEHWNNSVIEDTPS